MKYLLIFLIICACTHCVQAQNKLTYKSITSFSALYADSSKTAMQTLTIHGVLKKGWFTGLGVGVDEFNTRSVPVFANVSKFFGGDKYFASASIGKNYIWSDALPGGWRGNIIKTDRKAKLFYELCIGYKISFGKKGDGFILGAAYSYKHIQYINELTIWCRNPPCHTTTERYDFKLNRIAIRVGFVL